jgi:catechol 2,3-dioxygenase-like lactoylglutathione lyase family enzyme
MQKTYPRVVNHIAVRVTDLEKAVKWYQEILGFDLINCDVIATDDSSLIASNFRAIFGPHVKVKVAWLSAGNQVGFEIFEFVEPKAELRPNNFEYWKSGFFHICITDPNIDELCRKIEESGGLMQISQKDEKQCKEILIASERNTDHKLVYCKDPFGNIVEILTRSYEQVTGSNLH